MKSGFINTKGDDEDVMGKNMIYTFQVVISILFLIAYFAMLSAMFFVEVSDTLNMVKGENSLMSLLEVLLGVLTAGVGQILNYWLSDKQKNEVSEE